MWQASGDQNGMSDGHSSTLFASPSGNAAVLFTQIGIPGAPCGMGGLNQGGA
jgi:hypothetical protein